MVHMKPKQLKRANRKAWEAHKKTTIKRWLDARMKILLQRAFVEAGPEWAQIKLTDSLVGGQTYTFVMHCKQGSQPRPVPAGEPIEIYSAFPQVEQIIPTPKVLRIPGTEFSTNLFP